MGYLKTYRNQWNLVSTSKGKLASLFPLKRDRNIPHKYPTNIPYKYARCDKMKNLFKAEVHEQEQRKTEGQ